MQVKLIPITGLRPHPKNPRIHPGSAIEKLEQSINEFGWTNPVLVSADGYVLAGHARLKAAKRAGLEQVPVVHLPLAGAKAEAYLIADNRLAEETTWDTAALNDMLTELIAGDIDMVLAAGFDGYEVDNLLRESEGADFLPRENLEAAREFSQHYEQTEQEKKDEQRRANASAGDSNWFYVEYPGQAEKFGQLVEALEALRAMAGANEVCASFFHTLIRALD